MRKRNLFAATMVAVGVAAAVALPVASANATTARPYVNQEINIYKGYSYVDCENALNNAEIQYGSYNGWCDYNQTHYYWEGWLIVS